jgi:hypothetical protein
VEPLPAELLALELLSVERLAVEYLAAERSSRIVPFSLREKVARSA